MCTLFTNAINIRAIARVSEPFYLIMHSYVMLWAVGFKRGSTVAGDTSVT
uniref:Uncharacterized protein n=1 Tax=Arundo donax TaxID=35708 RepID=A0A0A8YIT1_ARUDO